MSLTALRLSIHEILYDRDDIEKIIQLQIT